MKGPAERSYEGIYGNPRLMHSVGIIVGCVVQVQVKNGKKFEGVLETFSSKADFVLGSAHRIDRNSNNSQTVNISENLDDYFHKIVFNFADVVMMSACNVDPNYATRETFTDTAISKYNGKVQIDEKPLEPWEGDSSSPDGLVEIEVTAEESNGWDPQDMFKTNEEKYGVKSSFDKTLSGYTIPLNKQNTAEYKLKEEKADKLASEIERSVDHKTRSALEDADEGDIISSVVRPSDNMNNFKYVPHRPRRSSQNVRNMRNNNTSHINRNTHHSQMFPRVSSPNNNSQSSYRQSSSSSHVSPRQTPASSPRQSHVQGSQAHAQPQSTPAHFQQASIPCPVNPPTRSSPPTSNTTIPQEEKKSITEADKTDLKFAPKPPRSLNLHSSANKEMRETVMSQQMPSKNIERRKEFDKKSAGQKAREEKTEDLKRFHAKFKLTEESKDNTEHKPDAPVKHHKKDEERKSPENRKSPETPKSFSLNPNAKEFVFSPNAKSFTPRVVSIPAVVPPPTQPPPRLHTQSPILAMPQQHLMSQAVFNVAPHYVVSTTPVSMAQMAPPFTPAASVAQAPRFRKAMSLTLRHDLSQPVHVQAATGQPILAQPAIQPQFTFQYATPPGMLHPSGHPQQLAYAQMYVPRVLAPPQSIGAYGESPQIPTHVYMSHPSGIPHAMTSGNGGHHSAPSTPQSQTPNIHPAPSPVHQPPPAGGHPPTPTGHHSNAPTPQPVIYSHSHVASPHPMHPNPHQSSNQGHPFAAGFTGTPQQIVLVPQQPHTPHPVMSLPNHLHGQPPVSHVGTPTHLLQHAPIAMIPTTGGMVHSQTATHYVPHSQG